MIDVPRRWSLYDGVERAVIPAPVSPSLAADPVPPRPGHKPVWLDRSPPRPHLAGDDICIEIDTCDGSPRSRRRCILPQASGLEPASVHERTDCCRFVLVHRGELYVVRVSWRLAAIRHRASSAMVAWFTGAEIVRRTQVDDVHYVSLSVVRYSHQGRDHQTFVGRHQHRMRGQGEVIRFASACAYPTSTPVGVLIGKGFGAILTTIKRQIAAIQRHPLTTTLTMQQRRHRNGGHLVDGNLQWWCFG